MKDQVVGLELEKQVTSLELSQRLKELGVKQDSYWVWVHPFKAKDLKHFYDEDNKLWKLMPRQSLAPARVVRHIFAAFTVAELGIALPIETTSEKWIEDDGTFFVRSEAEVYNTYENTEADARAKMLIYLMEEKLNAIKRISL